MLYQFRLNVGQRETTFKLSRRFLLIGRDNKVHTKIPLSEIQSVNLQSHGAIFDESMYRCVIRTDRRKILLSNIHYRGLARVENRNRQYTRFIQGLHSALLPYAEQIRFQIGHPLQAMFGAATTILAPAAMIMAAVAVFANGPTASLSIGAVGLCPFSAWGHTYWRKGKRKPYDPRALPTSHLPK